MIPAIPPIAPLPSAAPVAGGAAAPQPAPNLVDRFTSIMQNLETSPQGQVRAHGPSAINQFVASEDQAFKATLENTQAFSITETQDMRQLAQSVIHAQNEITMLSFKLNMASGLAQSGKSSVQTLMKNQ
jgi:type III secretion inner rod protein HrpB2